jgi:hypothetical protein
MMAQRVDAREAALQELLDRQAIHDVILRCGRAADRADLAMLTSCYHLDAYEDHGYFRGNAIEFAAQALTLQRERMDGGSHLMGSPFIELDGDRAFVETYVHAVMRSHDDEVRLHLTFAGRYLDTFERRNGEWRIAQRVVVVDYAVTDRPSSAVWPWGAGDDPVFAVGTQDERDPVYLLTDPDALRGERPATQPSH